MAKVSIIITVFNHAALTERCLGSVGIGEFEVVVVDDGSSDETPRLLDSLRTQVKAVRHSSNQGFSTSCNDGAAVASGEYLVFLNNDTVPQPGWLEALVEFTDSHAHAAVVGSKLLYPDNTVQHAGVVICQDRYPRHIYTGFPAEHSAVTKSRQFQIVTAACMLVRRQAFMAAGGFDTAFRNGFEDVDLCLRLREAGQEVHYCAKSIVQHLESVSPGRFKRDHENISLYRERWMGRVQPDDVMYYLQDGLLQFTYEGSFPIGISISTRLGIVEEATRASQSERLLEENARHIADLRRENTRLELQVLATVVKSEVAQYEAVRQRVREAVLESTPPDAKVLVVSKGDRALLDIPNRQARHFPQTSKGTYAGHHPDDSFTAIAQLEALRATGAEYLVFPSTAFWWLEYYRELERHLTSHYHQVANEPSACLIFQLRHSPEETQSPVDQVADATRSSAAVPAWQSRGNGGANVPAANQPND
jgi:GT2 family glycosyltransferase